VAVSSTVCILVAKRISTLIDLDIDLHNSEGIESTLFLFDFVAG
jgi:hypothetical protein